MTPLYQAVMPGNKEEMAKSREMVALLLACGADPNATIDETARNLGAAQFVGDKEAVKRLEKDLSGRHERGASVIEQAEAQGLTEIVAMLKEAAAKRKQ